MFNDMKRLLVLKSKDSVSAQVIKRFKESLSSVVLRNYGNLEEEPLDLLMNIRESFERIKEIDWKIFKQMLNCLEED